MIRIRKGHLTKARCVRSNRWNKSGHNSHLFSSLIPSINHFLPFQLLDSFNGSSRKHNLNMPPILLLHYCPYLFIIIAVSWHHLHPCHHQCQYPFYCPCQPPCHCPCHHPCHHPCRHPCLHRSQAVKASRTKSSINLALARKSLNYALYTPPH